MTLNTHLCNGGKEYITSDHLILFIHLWPRHNLMLHLCHSFNEWRDEKEGQSGKNDVMDIERAAVGEMRPTEPSLSNHMSTHTHTLDAVPLKWSPLFPQHTHTHSIWRWWSSLWSITSITGFNPTGQPLIIYTKPV